MKNIKVNFYISELKSQIELAAYHFSKEEFPYDVQCWEFSEFQLIVEKGRR